MKSRRCQVKWRLWLLTQEACDGIRGAQTYYRIVSRARDICNRINKLALDSDMNDNWEEYDAWTAQAGPLEKLLFSISEVAENEAEASYSPLEPRSIADCLDHIKAWKDNREICRNVSVSLFAAPFEPPAYAWNSDLMAAARHDDLSWISAVWLAIREKFASLPRTSQQKFNRHSQISDVVTFLGQVHASLVLTTNIDEATLILITRCFMLMHGVIAVAMDPLEDKAVRKHLSSYRTWKRALMLLQKLKGLIEDSSGFADEVQAWDAYEDYLLHPSMPSVGDILDCLILYPARIQRTYYAQTLVLVDACLSIGNYTTSNNPDDGIEELEYLVELVIEILQKISTAAIPIFKYDWNELRSGSLSLAIDKTVKEIRAVYEQYKMKVGDFDDMMDQGLMTDKTCYDLLQEHLGLLRYNRIPLDDILQVDSSRTNRTQSETACFRYDLFPALELVGLLIQSLQKINTFRDRPQTVTSIIDKAKDISDRTNEIILKAGRERDWNAYHRYTALIPRLEEKLFQFSKLAWNHMGFSLTDSQQSVQSCLDSIDRWKTGRNALKRVLVSLQFSAEEMTLDPDTVTHADDLSCLSTICDAITTFTPKRVPQYSPVVQLLTQIRNDLSQGRHHDDSTMVTIICYFALIHGILLIVTDMGNDIILRGHAGSEETWTKTLEQVQRLQRHVEMTSLQNTDEAWLEYTNYLLKNENAARAQNEA
ncbi:hypothetical protein FRC03_002767 [Tulasnella sp. 419]|nr:hypothetical protein FRC03_002767 [Tulasnella sp. 419]